jgi:hypothetical protein
VRRLIVSVTFVAVLAGGCGHSTPNGTVEGTFSLPGRPAADLARGGLAFLPGNGEVHRQGGIFGFLSGNRGGHRHTATVGGDGRYSVTLSAGSYAVIGALSGRPGGPVPESCAAQLHVDVTAHHTTHLDYVCQATPVDSSKPGSSPAP